jgi:hypothetical protein
MIGLWSAILLVQQAAAPARDSAAVEAARRDSLEAVAARRDSAHRARRRAQRDVLITPELSASAYHDAAARELIARARRARLEQDSTLVAYDATSRQRLTVWLSFRASGPERLLLRSENAARVRWQRGRGAVIDVIGARTAFPMFFTGSRVLSDFLEMDAIPYFPGREGLLQLGGAQTVTKSDESWFIHPLERGAEAYYAFRAGDSVIFRLPDGTRIHLQEVAVEARKPSADLIVGALWFDAASGQLVRGVFRPSVPIDIVKRVEEDDSTAFADVPTLVKPMIFPMELTITGFTVEYGLHEQRWWMPRSETVEGRVRAGFTHAAVAMEQSFTYANVNGRDTIPRLFASREDSLRHVPGDSLYKAARRAARDSAKMARDSAASLRWRAAHTGPRPVRHARAAPLARAAAVDLRVR